MSGKHTTARDFDDLLCARTPLLDVRAPVEFAHGAIPGATNLPLLDDEERHRVGIRYRQAGQDAAIRLGHELVSGAVRAARTDSWCRYLDAHPDAHLYCFRGGLRSATVRDWLHERGYRVPVIEGGYKALRNHLLARLEALGGAAALRVVGGRTGTGKTRLLERITRSIDLEGLANHRGSAFGPRVYGQPAPIDFENRLAVELLILAGAADSSSPSTDPSTDRSPAPDPATQLPIAIEDESRNVGRLSVPAALVANMAEAPLVLVEASMDERVQITLEDYVIAGRAEHEARYGAEAGFEAFSDYLLGALGKVRRRLGGVRHGELDACMQEALALQRDRGDVSAHEHWIRRLLEEYYDPMYDYQLAGKLDRVCFRGTREEVEDWLLQETTGHR